MRTVLWWLGGLMAGIPISVLLIKIVRVAPLELLGIGSVGAGLLLMVYLMETSR